ncbi:hypothetical protein P171DRAFT_442480 [Karstenula rhodostoma CBS 690.94]|uniref:Uncharacterized protein n=1 Tax=Karstenula rhodostoma CBS 690.94 TaxID=1392251 RepID=A0A9P4PNR6_9PLEO|nr:hypothetical protein P171DRAFT_442480 [Karstenula rhodostoma CBS 690.94]
MPEMQYVPAGGSSDASSEAEDTNHHWCNGLWAVDMVGSCLMGCWAGVVGPSVRGRHRQRTASKDDPVALEYRIYLRDGLTTSRRSCGRWYENWRLGAQGVDSVNLGTLERTPGVTYGTENRPFPPGAGHLAPPPPVEQLCSCRIEVDACTTQRTSLVDTHGSTTGTIACQLQFNPISSCADEMHPSGIRIRHVDTKQPWNGRNGLLDTPSLLLHRKPHRDLFYSFPTGFHGYCSTATAQMLKEQTTHRQRPLLFFTHRLLSLLQHSYNIDTHKSHRSLLAASSIISPPASIDLAVCHPPDGFSTSHDARHDLQPLRYHRRYRPVHQERPRQSLHRGQHEKRRHQIRALAPGRQRAQPPPGPKPLQQPRTRPPGPGTRRASISISVGIGISLSACPPACFFPARRPRGARD